MNTPPSTGIRFLRTPAGFIFLNLLAADATQALGFGLTWVWASHGRIEHNANLCLFQALVIQSGDVASAVFSFFIAFYTAVLLTTSRKPTDNLLYIAAGSSWIFVAFATFIGPLAIAKKSEGAFYGEAGNWCWISNSYSEMRLWLHYFFVRPIRATFQILTMSAKISTCLPVSSSCQLLDRLLHIWLYSWQVEETRS